MSDIPHSESHGMSSGWWFWTILQIVLWGWAAVLLVRGLLR